MLNEGGRFYDILVAAAPATPVDDDADDDDDDDDVVAAAATAAAERSIFNGFFSKCATYADRFCNISMSFS